MRSRLIPLSGKSKSPLYINKEDFYLHIFRNTETFTYDPAGNITALLRKGKKSNGTFGLVDNLTYAYGTNNQLLNVTDAITEASSNSNDFRDGTPNNTDDYAYDNNGNLIIDQNKGIGIAYNYLNLPQTIVTNTQVMHFAYTATGTKLQKKVCSTTPKTIFEQAQNYAINNNALQSPHIQYAKRFANISTQRNAATQNLNPTQLYQHLQDTINLYAANPYPTPAPEPTKNPKT